MSLTQEIEILDDFFKKHGWTCGNTGMQKGEGPFCLLGAMGYLGKIQGIRTALGPNALTYRYDHCKEYFIDNFPTIDKIINKWMLINKWMPGDEKRHYIFNDTFNSWEEIRFYLESYAEDNTNG